MSISITPKPKNTIPTTWPSGEPKTIRDAADGKQGGGSK